MKKLTRTIITNLLIFTIIFSSMGVSNEATYAIEKENNYSGEELFKGIFFGVDSATEEIKKLWPEERTELNNSAASLRQIELITAEIKNLEPNYFDDLHSAIYNKDYIKTESLFANLNKLLDQAIQNLINNGTIVIEGIDKSEHDGVGINAVAAVGTIVYLGAAVTTGAAVTHVALVTAGGVAAAYLAVVGGKYFWNDTSAAGLSSSSTSDNASPSFDREQFIDYIISAYN